MKALVLAGGRGTRLRPLTHTSAKQLVPVANKPVLYYGLEAIRAAGITSVGIITGDTGAEVREAVGDGSRFGLDITYIPQEAPLGLAHCVLIARDFLGDEPFVMYLGDNFLVGGIADLVGAFRLGGYDAQVLLTKVAEPRFYGVAELGSTGEIVGLQEKPDHPRSDLAIVGVYSFSPAIHEAVRAITPSARGELEITDAIQWLIENDYSVHSHMVTGYWKDTGRLQDLLECNRMILETVEPANRGTVDGLSEITGRVVIEPGAVVENSVLRGPIVVGADAKIQSSYIGPFTSIGPRCVVQDAEVEYSIVLDDSSVHGVSRLAHSLIGRNVEVSRAEGTPNTYGLMVGDHSRIQVRA
ncbi:glucose-1-phosphate thymidylyltransferase [Planomonospora parontospora]|uniref:glucose-1-phosphate thymidylyltransferase n=1 Tax=Planomonospora parontospora TaxID=58119 RepID=UPI00166F9515|nr:glucose-1-phosphate thymidylyltransferase [Planomonospora parontospora]GGL05660.1 glucose-1-phosphate thymidylyltransferase [Planomonospora parontospora subsp. antibiotica]GII14290.1 glucose-1-phosphate thymidylyltransferase [Planomonospora parontospora subsp. antibiotica]